MKYTPGIDGPSYLRARSAECLGLALGKPDRPARPRPAPARRAAPRVASGSQAKRPKDDFEIDTLPSPGRRA